MFYIISEFIYAIYSFPVYRDAKRVKSLSDLLDYNVAGGDYSQINVSPGFSIGGFAFDEGGYHLLFESDTDRSGGNEVYLESFGSLSDVLDYNVAGGDYSQIDVSPSFGIAGLAAEAWGLGVSDFSSHTI